MSRRRLRSTSNDSLELFLDTICNAFGGMVFLAILLAVLVQMRSASDTVTRNAVASLSPERVRELELRGIELTTLRFQLQQSIEALLSQAQLSDDPELQNVTNSLRQQEMKLTELEGLLSKLQQTYATRLREISDLRNANDQLEDELRQARQQQSDIEGQLSSELSSREEKIAPPQTHSVSKKPLFLLVRFGRIYQVFEDDDSLLINRTHVTGLRLLGKTMVSPIPTSGWQVPDKGVPTQFEKLLGEVSPHTHYIGIAVWTDSFSRFQSIKQVLLERGYNYQLIPLENEKSVTYGSTTLSPVVQ